MPDPVVIVDEVDAVRTVVLNRPESRNALDGRVIDALLDAVDLRPPAPRAIVLTGADDHFCSGGDRRLGLAIDNDVDRGLEALQEITRRLRNPGWVSIAAVNGWAVGGGAELALGCDILVAGSTARFQFPEAHLGVHVTGGASWLLPRVVGLSRANLLLLTGLVLDAESALSWGLVAEVTDPQQTVPRALKLARLVADQPHGSVSAAKGSLARGLDSRLDESLSYEQEVTGEFIRNAPHVFGGN